MAFLLISAKRNHPEKWYQTRWCQEQGGEAEVTLEDKIRCDCVTETYAVEIDFGNNWYEAVGQSTYYALLTNKRAGIVLILESVKDRKYWERLNRLIEAYNLPIEVWAVGAGAESEMVKKPLP